jgi:site-specific DNA-cytosine methylase
VLLADGPRDGRGTDERHPPSPVDAPSMAIKTNTGRDGSGAALAWPWDRPSTTVCSDERIPPPGHHDANSYMSEANAIVLSERAAAILQGFPDGWLFAGETKKARWSQIGQAMPPPLAHAVAAAVRDAMARADESEAA